MQCNYLKKILSIVLIAILCITAGTASYAQSESGSSQDENLQTLDLDYNETLDVLNNPERGFYRTQGVQYKTEGNTVVKPNAKLVHLRVDLSNFSGAFNGNQDLELTQDMLESLAATLDYIQTNGASVIIRFSYDNKFNGNANMEPSMDMMLRHIQQLGTVLSAHKDVIAYLECGMFGPWGEMHTSKCCTNENIALVVSKWLEVLPESMTIGVRQPSFYAAWAGIAIGDIDQNVTVKGTDAYRVGLYNDGYLGSESDLGTYRNRTKEVAWLKNQAKHTLFGGEFVANFATGTPLNTAAYMSKEAFNTHTTYLNYEWNQAALFAMKDEVYAGDDAVYQGQSGYTYIENHLGYRFVLKDAKVTKEVPLNRPLQLQFDMENVGFANLVNGKKVSLVLKNETDTYEIETDIDPTSWDSQSVARENVSVALPEGIVKGEYQLYLRISKYGDLKTDQNYQCIQLANDLSYDAGLGATQLATIEVVDKATEATSTSSESTTSTTQVTTSTESSESETSTTTENTTTNNSTTESTTANNTTTENTTTNNSTTESTTANNTTTESTTANNTTTESTTANNTTTESTTANVPTTESTTANNTTTESTTANNTTTDSMTENVTKAESTTSETADIDGVTTALVTTQDSNDAIQTSRVTINSMMKIPKIGRKKVKKKAIQLTLKCKTKVTGYEVRYSTMKSMKGYKRIYKRANTVTIRNLKRKKVYYIKIRAYLKNDTTKQVQFSKWSNKYKLKTK